MENNVSIAVVNKNVRFNGRVNYMLDNAKNKVGSYSKEKVEAFKKKMVVALEKAYDTYVDFDIAINDAMDAFGDRLIDGYENFAEKIREIQPIAPKREAGSAYDKLKPMMSDEEFRRLGIDIDNEDSITELQEFKKELMMGNFPQSKENKGPVRRRIRSRGVFNIWMTVLISILFLGIFIVVASLGY